ncbi:hypothetical protein DM02DRAFT_413767 [Periconia macrospinosa]|uniref:Uncharacterized protein n=1 Tax=Periconia macrospinosa TaxID=97972 RepID=A0A2V1DPC9_9PLEO|nr:hypothetical protein DM02DRAFT_413767 [Periconia macrospinosa]
MTSSNGIQKDVFSFEHVLLAEASNKTRHPRASVPELQAILRPTDAATHQPDKNVSHWWEAQLLHYGLKPSKTKAVAKTRLLDALNSSALAVPAEVVKLEGQLKKSWNKSEKERRSGQDLASSAGGAKRKRKQNDEAEKPTPVKKPKATVAKTPQPAETKTQPKAKANASTTARKETKTKASKTASEATTSKNSKPSASELQDVTSATNRPRTKQTARRSRGGIASSPGRTPLSESSIPPSNSNRPRTKQTARRSKPFLHPGRGGHVGTIDSRTPGSWDEEATNESGNDGDSDIEMVDVDSSPRNSSLGLINGTYELTCSDLEEWDYTSDDFTLILCLEGDSVWGEYDFGMFSGIIHLRQRPYSASNEQLPFQWRGREHGEDVMSFGPSNTGWLVFHGGGRISGMINCYGNAVFQGVRISGNETRSERSSRSMREEWDGYNQREYDRENRARWGGSGW